MNKILNLFFVLASIYGLIVCGFNFIRSLIIINNDVMTIAFAILTALMVALVKTTYKDFTTEE